MSKADASPRLSWRETAFLVVFAFVIALLGRAVRPYWDDGWFELFRATGKPFAEGLSDRPFVCALLNLLNSHGILWPVAHLMHFVGWTAMAWAVTLVWSVFFPELPQWRLAAGAVGVAPVICQIQMSVIFASIYLCQIALVFVAFWLLLPRTKRQLLTWRAVIAGMMVFVATLFTEYAVPTAFAVGVLLFFLNTTRGVRLIASLALAAFLPIVAVSGYALYYKAANAELRKDVRISAAGAPVDSVRTALTARGKHLANDLWQVSIGRTISAVGELKLIEDHRGENGAELPNSSDGKAFFCLVAGIVAALGLAWGSQRDRAKTTRDGKVMQERLQGAAVLLVAIVAGLLPVAAMRRAGNGYVVDSRYWLPILPCAVCLTIFLISSVLRDTKARLIGLALLGYVCGHRLARVSQDEIQLVQRTRVWGENLRTRMTTDGLNIAFLVFDEPNRRKAPPVETSYELTARITEGWPVSDRNRFWAWTAGLSGELPNPDEIVDFDIRNARRAGAVQRYLWLRIDTSGHIRRMFERIPETGAWEACF